MGYQSFPWQDGSSRSFEKLLSLSLPVLRGRTVLDVGCNTGYFCGWAHFQLARRVVGIDRDPASIAQAREYFPDCSFLCMDWNGISEIRYDVILCLSSIHYADDQKRMLDLLMSRLAPDGLLVLELGIAPGDGDEFVAVSRNIDAQTTDTRLFPTWKKMRSMLSGYAQKYMGESVRQAGDPLSRHVWHIYHRKPIALLLMDRHYSGKSFVVERMLNADAVHIAGDAVYADIMEGRTPAGDGIKQHIRYYNDTRHMIPPAITADICAAGLLPELAEVYLRIADRRDFILEHYIPDQYRDLLCEIMDKAGFFVAALTLFDAYKNLWTRERPPYRAYEAYSEHLRGKFRIDEEAYLAANPDVAKAVAEGRIPSGQQHYWSFGRQEGRALR